MNNYGQYINEDFYEKSISSFEQKGIKVVLGNGFDLFCGLRTRYLHFFLSEKSRYSSIRKWCESFKDIEVYISRKTSNWNCFGPQIKCNVKFNIWDLYFTLCVGEKDYDWCDIEDEMLKTFNKGENKLHWRRVFRIVNNDLEYDEATNEEHIIVGYIIDKNCDVSSLEKFYMFLLEELKLFEKHFGEYVNNEYLLNHNEYLRNASIFYSLLKTFDDDVTSKETFNYTDNSIMNFISSSEFLNDIKHINGDYKNPIFGIDSSKIDADSPEFIFTKVSRRMINSVLNKLPVESSFDKEFNHIVVFGHSLNVHDFNYFFPIFDYLDILNIMKNSTITFVYYVYDKNKKEEIVINNIKMIVRLIDAYEKYAGKNRDNRLIDTLTIDGRIKFIEIDK